MLLRCSYFLFIQLFFHVVVVTASGNDLPLADRNILRIEQPGEIQYQSTLIQTESANVLVYESWGGHDMKHGRLRYSQLSMNNGKIGADTPRNLKIGSDSAVVTSLSKITLNSIDWLYYIEAKSFNAEASLFRAKLDAGKLIEQEAVLLTFPIAPSSNIRLHLIDGNKVALVFTGKKCCELYFSISDDGLIFNRPSELGNTGFMPFISSFPGGEIVYFFQKSIHTSKTQPSGKPVYITKTHFRISSNLGNTWTEAVPINLIDVTVHDAKAVIRLDGNIDVYYVYPIQEDRGLSLWRRCLNPHGQLGSEELVVDPSFGNIAKPTPHRLKNGELLITFVEQGKVVLEGYHNLHAAIISRDANCHFEQDGPDQ